MSENEEQLKRMVMTFRVSELQMLLGYAGKNKTGRKNELQSRALDIVKMRNPSIQQKIKELYKSIQLEMMSFGDRGQANAGTATGGIMPALRVPSLPSSYSQSGTMANAVNASGYSNRSAATQGPSIGGYSSLQSSHSSYPINPDVRLKRLPFYDLLGELLKPSTLAPQGSGRYQEANFSFSLTPQQANKIAHSRDMRPGKQDYTVQVQMRFCLLETTCEQEDNFPPNINVKINDKMCPLPSPIPTNKQGVEPKRPPRPVNVTALCKISPTVSNRILVSWSSDYGRCYVISVYLVQRLTSEDLLQRLKQKGPRLGDFTKSLIKQKLREDGECEIATTSLRCSLLCPLGKMRMVLPCRSETCNHLQCFDASLFLQMNERKPTWTCPVCDKPAIYDNLVIDGYFQEVLQRNGSCSEVTLQKDGAWAPLAPKKEPKEPQQEKKKSEVAVETLIDDSDDSEGEESTPQPQITNDSVIEEEPSKRKDVDVEIITLSDSDEESLPPPSKRPAYETSSSTNEASSNPPDTSASSPLHTSNTSHPCESGAGFSTDGRDEEPSRGTESTKANDSWCVGEVDPGKRLIFRKSVTNPSSNTGGLAPPSNVGGPTSVTSPGSSGSTSPQIICLDSPVSSPSPKSRNHLSSAQVNNSLNPSPSLPPSSPSALAPTPSASFASPRSESSFASPRSESSSQPSPFSAFHPLSPPLQTAGGSITSELRAIRNRDPIGTSASSAIPITPALQSPLLDSSITPTSPSAGNAYSMLQDPYGINALTNNTLSPYSMPHSGLPNIFNPMAMIDPNVSPPTTSPNMNPYITPDRYL